MFVALSPSESCASETLCSLNFASRVAKVELGQAKRNMVDNRVVRFRPPACNRQAMHRAAHGCPGLAEADVLCQREEGSAGKLGRASAKPVARERSGGL